MEINMPIQLTESSSIKFSNICKAEARKSTDTQAAKTIILTTVFLTIAMFVVSIFRFEDGAPWTKAVAAISSPATTILAISFILLVCEEWTRGTALITYTFVPQRSKVILAKFVVLLECFLGTILLVYALSALAAIIGAGMHGYSINWTPSITSVVSLAGPLLVNLLFGYSMALATQETTLALGLYFILPPVTVVATQLPVIGEYMKWVSLEHSSSMFVAGATSVTVPQYICSIIVWIVIPSIFGIIRNMKRDMN